jgi:hypothetical protein
MMSKSLLIICLIFILSGCASNESTGSPSSRNPNTASGVILTGQAIDNKSYHEIEAGIDYNNVQTPEGEKLYCKKETITGSHRPHMTCQTMAQKEAHRRNSDRYLGRTGGYIQ